jgi:hypothetical protein
MTRITIVTKLRLAAAIAPLVLLIASLILAGGFYLFGSMPAMLRDNQFAAQRAADGMEAAIYKMDWGRKQPDGLEIVKGQERRFVNWVDSARLHATTRDQLEKLNAVAQTANPIFDAMRKAPEDDDIEPKLDNLQERVADLSEANVVALREIVVQAQSRARMFMGIALVAGVAVPWAAFFLLSQMAGQVNQHLREMRARVEKLAEGPAAQSGDLKMLDEGLAALGYPKPNPMFAE